MPENYEMTEKEKEMHKALNCLYLAVPSAVADDVKSKVLAAVYELKEKTS